MTLKFSIGKIMDISFLVDYIYKKFPEPKSYSSKQHVIKRACEISTAEQVILLCINNPFKDVIDILDDYAFELEFLEMKCDNEIAKKRLRYSIDTIYILLDYVKFGGKK